MSLAVIDLYNYLFDAKTGKDSASVALEFMAFITKLYWGCQ